MANKHIEQLIADSLAIEAAKQRNPQRWSGENRNWTPGGTVWINPENPDAQVLGTRDMAA